MKSALRIGGLSALSAALLLALALGFPTGALAQDDDNQSGSAPPPPPAKFEPRELPPEQTRPVTEDELPEKVRPPDELEPEVRITRDDEGTITEEYRLNGLLYMVKVSPKGGTPWYLIDTDGDGQLEKRTTELGPHLNVPHWVLLEW